MPRGLLRGRWAFTPPFHPYPPLLLRKAAGGLFSVTLSVTARFHALRPRILHGLLSGGVRTFLSRASRERSSVSAAKLPGSRMHASAAVQSEKQKIEIYEHVENMGHAKARRRKERRFHEGTFAALRDTHSEHFRHAP